MVLSLVKDAKPIYCYDMEINQPIDSKPHLFGFYNICKGIVFYNILSDNRIQES